MYRELKDKYKFTSYRGGEREERSRGREQHKLKPRLKKRHGARQVCKNVLRGGVASCQRQSGGAGRGPRTRADGLSA